MEAAGEAAEQHRMWAGGGEGDADFAGSLDDPARDLEQVQPEVVNSAAANSRVLGMRSRRVSSSR